MEAADQAASAALPLTRVIAAQVRRRRTEAGMSGGALAERMTQLGMRWTRTTVAKFETGHRASVSVQELLTLALALDVPPVSLIADPRGDQQVPIADGVDVEPWRALLYLVGVTRLDEIQGPRGDDRAAQLIYAGYRIIDSVQLLEMEGPDPARTDEDHRSALRTITTQLRRAHELGAPFPALPDWVRRRAAELGVSLPDPPPEET